MVTALRALLFILWCTVLATSAHAQDAQGRFIRVTLENAEIVEGDTVVVEIEHSGLQDPLDLSALTLLGTQLRQTAGTRIAVIGGKVVEIKLLRIQFIPEGQGRIIIGPLTAGDVMSNSVALTIAAPPSEEWAPGPDDFSIAMRVASDTVFVQEPVLLALEFRHRHPITEAEFTLPDLAGFRFEEIEKARRTVTDDDGGWRVISWTFMLYPEHSGRLAIPSFRVRGSMVKSRLERGLFEAATSAVDLDVRPAASSGWWLPARSVRFTEEWDADPRELQAGEERLRTVTVTATGARGSQIPDIAMSETQGLLITPLATRRATKIDGDTVTGTAEFDFRIRAISPVPVFLDTIRLQWFDTVEKAPREAILPARRINVGVPNREALLEAFTGEDQRFLVLGDALSRARNWLIAAFALAGFLAALSMFDADLFRRWQWPDQMRAVLASARLSFLLVSRQWLQAWLYADRNGARFRKTERLSALQGILEHRLFGLPSAQTARDGIPRRFSLLFFRAKPFHGKTATD